MLLALSACGAAGGGHVIEKTATPARSGDPVDPSFDWHVLLLVPFGTLLKEVPIPLHEVLLFNDDKHGAPDVAGTDCHAVERTPPRFVGQIPDQYLLCFEHDRLTRIEATVHLPARQAAPDFSRACALWLKSATTSAPTGNVCEGRDAGVAYSARLAAAPGTAAAPVSITLSDARAP